jgi:Domain of unknown function (DUF4136)
MTKIKAMPYLQTFFLLIACLLTTGCASMRIEKKTFHTLTNDQIVGKTFSVYIEDKDQRNSLEFKSHAKILGSLLSAKGMKEVVETPGAPADFVVFFGFSITGESKTGVGSVPHYNTSGGTSSFNATTTGGGRTYNTYGTVSSYPTLQYAGSSTYSYDYKEYTRDLRVGIYTKDEAAKKNPTPAYEGQAYSVGSLRDTTKLIPVLLETLLSDFPGTSGKSETLARPLN